MAAVANLWTASPTIARTILRFLAGESRAKRRAAPIDGSAGPRAGKPTASRAARRIVPAAETVRVMGTPSCFPRQAEGWRALEERRSGSPTRALSRAPAAAFSGLPSTALPRAEDKAGSSPASRARGLPSCEVRVRGSTRLKASLWQPVIVPAGGPDGRLPAMPACETGTGGRRTRLRNRTPRVAPLVEPRWRALCARFGEGG